MSSADDKLKTNNFFSQIIEIQMSIKLPYLDSAWKMHSNKYKQT